MSARPAILDVVRPGAPTLIEASAGTGKTWTLEQIVLERLRSGASIESILVVTFTDKATREMRARVRATLDERVRAGETALAPALVSFDRAPISTIHAFCQRLLKEHAFDGGRLFREERVDASALLSRALRSVLREGLVPGAPLEPFLLAAIDVVGTGGLESSVLELARERGEIEPRFDLPALDAALGELAAAPDPAPELERAVAHAGTRGRALRGLTRLRSILERAPGAGAMPPLGELMEWAASGEPPMAAWLEETLAKTSLAAPLGVLASALSTPSPMIAAHLLPAVRERAMEGKRALGALDYDDLLFDLRDALRAERGETLRARVRARLRHVLVDEFQDTDPVQWEIFRRLFFDCAGDRTFVLIGDPKQAIYSFRGADLRTYERARAEVRASDGGVGYLAESHRSSPAFVEALHRILLPTGDEPPFFTGHNAYPAPVRAARSEPAAVDAAGVELPPVTLFHLESQTGPIRLKAARLAHGRAMATEIESLLGSPPLLLARDGTHRPLVASDVFVLTRSAAESREVGEALARRGIPHAFFKQDGLYATVEARDFLDVLRALASPDDTLLRARALLTPFFAVALEDLGAVRTLDRTHPVLATFFELASLATRGELASLFSALTDRAGLVRRELYLHQSERRLTNYLHLAEVALRLCRQEHSGLGGLVRALSERVEGSGGRRGEDDEDVQRLESDAEAVQVLTMHKAKGLEAHVVFLYGGFGRRRPDRGARRTYHAPDGRRVAHVGPGSVAVEAAIAAEEREEDERLLYVAMTRARACLYLPYAGRGPGSTPGAGALTLSAPGPMGTVLGRLAEIVPRATAGTREAALFRRIDVDVDEARRGVRAKVKTVGARTRAEVLALRSLSPLPEVEIERLRAAAGGAIVTSYTRMKGERAHALEGAAESDEDTDLLALRGGADADEGDQDVALRDPGGREFGVAVHALLERLDPERAASVASAAELLADPACVALAEEVLEAAGVAPEALPRAIELTWDGLRTPLALPGLALPGGLGSVGRRAVEVPFLHPIPERAHVPLGVHAPEGWAAERGYVRGVVDVLLEHEGRTFVVDWKTDRVAEWTEECVDAHVRAGYEVQLRLYALAAARMPGLGGREAWEARFGGVLYVFLRGLAVAPRAALYFARPTHDELVTWDEEMRASDSPWGHPLGVGRRRP